MQKFAPVIVAAGLLAVAGAAKAACPPGLRQTVTAELFFGRDIGPAPGVSDADWRNFVDAEITPRFPTGVSVADDYGQWRGSDGALVREPSKALLLVLTGTADEQAKIAALREAYKARFHQQSVLLIEREACVSF
jgi:Protein of unknown function (DUF3574)